MNVCDLKEHVTKRSNTWSLGLWAGITLPKTNNRKIWGLGKASLSTPVLVVGAGNSVSIAKLRTSLPKTAFHPTRAASLWTTGPNQRSHIPFCVLGTQESWGLRGRPEAKRRRELDFSPWLAPHGFCHTPKSYCSMYLASQPVNGVTLLHSHLLGNISGFSMQFHWLAYSCIITVLFQFL